MFLFFLGEYPGAEWLFVRYMLSFFLKWILSGYLFGWCISGWLLRCVSVFWLHHCLFIYWLCCGGMRDLAAAAKSASVVSDSVQPHRWHPPGSPVRGILQARTLEWAAISFSNAWKWKVKVQLLRRVRLLTPRTVTYQAPPSMGFSRQESWSGVPLPTPGSSFPYQK